MKIIILLALGVSAACVAGAQAFNVDFDGNIIGVGVPASSFGGAGQVGGWNAAPIGATVTLYDIAYNNTTVQLSSTGFDYFSNKQGYTGNDLLLMADVIDGGTGFSFRYLADGLYNVTVYAQAPDDETYLTDVIVGGATQTVGGAWSGNYVLGNTHAYFVNVLVKEGILNVGVAKNTGFTSLNGVQITPVPEQETLTALAIGLALLSVLRPWKLAAARP